MTHHDFCIWLQGYLDNPSKPDTIDQLVSPIKEKLKLLTNTSQHLPYNLTPRRFGQKDEHHET